MKLGNSSWKDNTPNLTSEEDFPHLSKPSFMHNGAITRSKFVSPSSRSNYKDSSTESEKAKKQDFSLEQSKTTACEPLSHQSSDNHKDAVEEFRLNSSNDSHRTIEENVGSHTSGGHNENNFTHNVSDEKNENGHNEASAKGKLQIRPKSFNLEII